MGISFEGDNLPYSRPNAPNDGQEDETLYGVGTVGDFAQHGFKDADSAVWQTNRGPAGDESVEGPRKTKTEARFDSQSIRLVYGRSFQIVSPIASQESLDKKTRRLLSRLIVRQ